MIISVVMAGAAAVMSYPLFVGTQLKPFVTFNKTAIPDILICSDERTGSLW